MISETENDLENKQEVALAKRLKQNPALAKIRFRRNVEDSAKVNQDCIIVAKRLDGNPLFSGIFNLEISITLTMRHRLTVDTLPQFLALCKEFENVLVGISTYTLAAQLSLCAEDFHCYEIAVIGKDDSPVDQKHSCIWTLTAISMAATYSDAAKLQTQTPNE